MPKLCRPVTLGLFLLVLLGPFSRASNAQAPTEGGDTLSFDRVQSALNTTPAHSLKFDARMPVPAATFRVTVTQPNFVLPIMDSLRKQFELTPLQRQSADWASKCCGINLVQLTDKLERAIRDIQERRARDRVARELAEVIAAER